MNGRSSNEAASSARRSNAKSKPGATEGTQGPGQGLNQNSVSQAQSKATTVFSVTATFVCGPEWAPQKFSATILDEISFDFPPGERSKVGIVKLAETRGGVDGAFALVAHLELLKSLMPTVANVASVPGGVLIGWDRLRNKFIHEVMLIV